MAKRSKQQKPCPNRDCRFPTKNRQSRIRKDQLDEIASIDPEVIPSLEQASICSSCGCVYVPGDHKWPVMVGFHDDPLIEDRESAFAVWWSVEIDAE